MARLRSFRSCFPRGIAPRQLSLALYFQRELRPVPIDRGLDNVRFYHLCQADTGRIKTVGVGREVQVAREFAIV